MMKGTLINTEAKNLLSSRVKKLLTSYITSKRVMLLLRIEEREVPLIEDNTENYIIIAY